MIDGPLLFLRLWTAAHRSERVVARELAADGLEGPQLALLLLVELVGPASTTQLADGLGVPFMTASDALGRLVAAGDVSREPNPRDGRSHVFALTAPGRARAAAVRAPLSRALEKLDRASAGRLEALDAAVSELDRALAAATAATDA